MRLPQSSRILLSLRVFSTIVLITFTITLPQLARAAKQQLVCSPGSVSFGSVQIGQSEAQFVVLTNNGQSSVTVSAASVSGAEFSVSALSLPVTLAAGQSVTLNVAFAPNNTGWSAGKVTFTGNASSLQLALGGTGATSEPLSLSPSSLSFGQVSVGSSATLPVVMTNTRKWSETLKGVQTTGAGYTVSGASFPMTLGPGKSVTLNVTFTAQAAGPSGGDVFIAGPALNIPLAANGSTIGTLSASPATLSFGKVMVGQTATQTAVLTASGGSVTISSAASSSALFALPGASFPITIGSGQSLQFNVTFTPQASGTVSAKVSFASNASDPTDIEGVAGTGTLPQVSLGWSPSTSSVQGYNVYRGTSPGKYSKINSALDASTSFTDMTVSSGATYYYAATAVNSAGQESSYSAPVEVAVP